ncbi:hypothetical protein FB451DRAFT_1237030 [Mycena latifolia]|nr:hypothetical protein FB451DRAFT_1237030 [Mycena latifolia]
MTSQQESSSSKLPSTARLDDADVPLAETTEPSFYDAFGPYDTDCDSDMDGSTSSRVESSRLRSAAEPQPAPSLSACSINSQPFVDSVSGIEQTTFSGYPVGSPPVVYPAWANDHRIPLSQDEIDDIFLDLAQKFGFQRDSMQNMFDLLMQQLDSRASQTSPNEALLSLHAEYISGEHANYRKWYFTAQLNLDDAFGPSRTPGLAWHERWRLAMHDMKYYDRVRQLALYLLVWTEGSQLHSCPAALYFIFKCADDYYRSPECQNRFEPVPEGLYLRCVLQPMDSSIRKVVGSNEHDYYNVNQLFRYPRGIVRIILQDQMRCSRVIHPKPKAQYPQTRLVDIHSAQRFMRFSRIDWDSTFETCKRRSLSRFLVNLNRVWRLFTDSLRDSLSLKVVSGGN